ncbi:hypothetical protein TcWFU_009918 [Taenia crassiceps]|uniref:Uncharacterized protein n=1 Tax=Taenia crassiceps TaxID=6207 RepID=A0ABR4QAT6_9CEST
MHASSRIRVCGARTLLVEDCKWHSYTSNHKANNAGYRSVAKLALLFQLASIFFRMLLMNLCDLLPLLIPELSNLCARSAFV